MQWMIPGHGTVSFRDFEQKLCDCHAHLTQYLGDTETSQDAPVDAINLSDEKDGDRTKVSR